MSNLSLARIMYGSNEDPGTSAWMHSASMRSQLPNSLHAAHSSSETWMSRILTVLLPNRAGNGNDSTKNIS
ncbi:MAG TPA: hypothetical protein VII25_05705 [Candidatus Acidoferrum sp.]|jgi:hypothetical protein